MTSIARRATPSQARIMRAVEGAVKNAVDHHPDWEIDPRFRRSIAKRAAGTLTAGWPDTLAAARAVRQTDGASEFSRSPSPKNVTSVHRGFGQGSRLSASRRDPLLALRQRLTAQIKPAKDAGQTERAEALIDVLRIIAEMLEPLS
jgi:hypothetical protein